MAGGFKVHILCNYLFMLRFKLLIRVKIFAVLHIQFYGACAMYTILKSNTTHGKKIISVLKNKRFEDTCICSIAHQSYDACTMYYVH